MHWLDPIGTEFPDVESANEMGVVAIGGELSVDRLKKAYRSGIFPWYNEGEPILWWSPDPRMVLFPSELYVSKSMRKVMRDSVFDFSLNKDFKGVIAHCAKSNRKGQNGTWITQEMQDAYLKLHQENMAFSVEVWRNAELVGGLYGVRYGAIASGESMFSTVSNASKAALIWLVEQWRNDVILIDCQEYTDHLASMGAQEIPRKKFINFLEQNNKAQSFSL